MVQDVPEPSVAAFRRPDLRALHEHDAPGGVHADSMSITSWRQGVREVRHGPGSDDARLPSIRPRSAHGSAPGPLIPPACGGRRMTPGLLHLRRPPCRQHQGSRRRAGWPRGRAPLRRDRPRPARAGHCRSRTRRCRGQASSPEADRRCRRSWRRACRRRPCQSRRLGIRFRSAGRSQARRWLPFGRIPAGPDPSLKRRAEPAGHATWRMTRVRRASPVTKLSSDRATSNTDAVRPADAARTPNPRGDESSVHEGGRLALQERASRPPPRRARHARFAPKIRFKPNRCAPARSTRHLAPEATGAGEGTHANHALAGSRFGSRRRRVGHGRIPIGPRGRPRHRTQAATGSRRGSLRNGWA